MRNLEKRSSKTPSRKKFAVKPRSKASRIVTKKTQAGLQKRNAFLAKISHTLRTRLNAIIGFSEMIRNEQAGQINQEQREYLNDIISSANDLSQLINQNARGPLKRKAKTFNKKRS